MFVLDGRVIARARDRAATEGDPILHAEVGAIREAVRTTGRTDLSGGVIVSTCEPCPMCASLAIWSNLSAIFYGASIEETAVLGKTRIRVSARTLVEASPVWMDVEGGIRKQECLALYSG